MNQTTLNDYSERILRVQLHIQNNLDVELSLDSLADVACFSPYHFHRVFAAVVGESVMAHVRRLRLERAARRLRSTRSPVIRMALEAGYETHEAFSRAFKAMTGLSPTAFRKSDGGVFANSVPGSPDRGESGANTLPTTHDGGDGMEIRVEDWEPRQVAFVRHIGPYEKCGAAWERLCTWAAPRGLLAGGPTMLGISYDDPNITPADKIRYDACLVVDGTTEAKGEVGVQEVAGGKYVVATHEGPYEEFTRTYSYLYAEWLPQNGWECRDAPCVEQYLNDPGSTPPEELLTLVCIPVQRK